MNDRFKFRLVWEVDKNINPEFAKYQFETISLGSGIPNKIDGFKLISKDQCTGLKDKNDKLIYKGDIVKIGYDYDEHIGEIIINGVNGAFMIGIKNERIDTIDAFLSEPIEIIGNIYKNLKLLEGEIK